MCYAAIGTDTAGSVREPASLCGVVGLKPTYGRVSARGVIPLSASLDHVGPLTASVADAAAVFDAIAEDNPEPVRGITPEERRTTSGTRQLRIGVPRTYFFDDLDSEVASAVEEALSTLKTMVAEVRELNLAVNTDRSLQAAESYACHADWIAKSPDLYDPETLRRIRTGEKFTVEDRFRLSAELADERRKIATVFEQVDVLITPTVRVPAPAMSALRETPDALRPAELLLLLNTRPFNVWGVPAISIPCGFTRSGLPIGLQIAGPHWGESLILSLARAYERETEWHQRKPSLSG
jgi:Asp-tRNA(Asn)/Glu-tRNA(Gln) amidotransferase A subunit family amidase